MAKKDKRQHADGSTVYKIIEIVGTSPKSWAEAARSGIEVASRTVRDLRVAEVDKLDVKIEGGVLTYRAKLKLSFKLHGEE
ncbi:MAG: dodecin family protein [Betaproteobacteria bacterium]